MLGALLLLPTAAGLVAFVLRSTRARRTLLVLTAVGHFALTAAVAWRPPAPLLGGALALDAAGLLFLGITSALFLAASLYAVGYLQREQSGRRQDFEEGFLFSNAPEATFVGCLLLFLATMTFVTVVQHFGLLWVAIEATTLASAPLIYFHRHHRSLEATWKYLLICSVGIGLALLGSFFLAVAATTPAGDSTPLVLADLVAGASRLQTPWLKASFLLLLVGYGTKVGLAPLHTWLPDAHSESPSVVSALLSGALLNCAFLGILRALQVCAAAGLGEFGRELLTVFGVASMAAAAVFLLGQADYKRLLAYSSVEHMGIVALGIGVGGTAGFGALLHAVGHSLTKAMLFLVAGNILACYRTKSTDEVRGVLSAAPVSGVLWLLGLFAITGSPPFAPFLSEFTILRGALAEGRGVVAALYLVLLGTIFVGMASVMLRMAQGAAPQAGPPRREAWLAIVPPMLLAAAVLVLGVWIPAPLDSVLRGAARAITGAP
ncbi:MAG TPA: proton-conducting transporter membrane subunit [Candidatus Polarisedimenticolaceae bacterium]|nr:proton-conducting transporter membrane subunit [Candidatus Polarisedimenticolaceae bacterium]